MAANQCKDITYVKLGCEFAYLAMLMDVFARII